MPRVREDGLNEHVFEAVSVERERSFGLREFCAKCIWCLALDALSVPWTERNGSCVYDFS